MKLLIINNTQPEDAYFIDPLIRAVSSHASVDVIPFNEVPNSRDINSRYQGVILSGVPLHYSFESIGNRAPYTKWIKESTVPVLGICMGHENIGSLYGASIIHDLESEEGTVNLHIDQYDPIFDGLSEDFEAMSLHRGSITLPDDFIRLASSKKCKNHVIKHKQKYIYGFQSHPELSGIGDDIFGNFVSIAKKLASVGR